MNRQEKILLKSKSVELVVLYFKYKRVFNNGFQQYKIFKNMIIYITGINNNKYIRNIFEIMLTRKLFEIKFIRKSRYYLFNPYHINFLDINLKMNFN